MKTYHIEPVAKCRMTRSDKWRKRKCVLKYWDFKDKVKELGIEIPESGSRITFYVSMPKSWSIKKRKEMLGHPHKQRKDIDNFLKGLMDSVFEEDSHVWDVRITKFWAETGMITVENIK